MSHPNNPQAIRILKEPEIGLFLKEAEQDNDFYVIIADGKEWVANKKFIKRLRKDYVS